MGDLISRKSLYEKLARLEASAREDVLDAGVDSKHHLRLVAVLCERTAIKHMIMDEPDATDDRRTGHWEYDENGYDWGIGAWRCSECGCKNDNLRGGKNMHPSVYAGSKYCPHCGVRMVKR